MTPPDENVGGNLVMALLYVEGTPDEATDKLGDAIEAIKASGSKGVAVSFTERSARDPRFWRDIRRFGIDPGDVVTG